MTTSGLAWGSPDWWIVAGIAGGVATLVLLWSYFRAPASGGVRMICATLKAIGFAALILCLVEPLLVGTRPRPGANSFVLLTDNSQSLTIRAGDDDQTRGEWYQAALQPESPWQTRLGQDFDVRTYTFDSHLRSVDGFNVLAFDGNSSSLHGAMNSLGRRFRELPLAGVLLFSDGNATDTINLGAGSVDWTQLPPIYPVLPPQQTSLKDIHIENVSVSQTNFESAPVVIRADVFAEGYSGERIVAVVEDESGLEMERQVARAGAADEPLHFRFQIRPITQGVAFYTVRAFAADEETVSIALQATPENQPRSPEPTLVNNSRLVCVDRGGGPYRVLYVSGRPNWEFKYLRRAVDEDEQVDVVGLVRIAKREPRFDFRDLRDRDRSSFFEGFDHPDDENVERHDEPVLVRLNIREGGEELRDGFPKTQEELYGYHAIVLDDIEAEFFTQDQLSNLRNFVSQRGGGLLMLGGPDSYTEGEYDRTPVGEMLPVYLDKPSVFPGIKEYHLSLTREGWLQPWVRTRETEDEERYRLNTMNVFRTLTYVGEIKPGAVVLSEVHDNSGNTYPALVAQSFGKGRVASFLLGDLWRWGMRRETPETSDLEKSWRQMIRWMVADVPQRVDMDIKAKADSAASAMEILVRVRDEEYLPLDNATVKVTIQGPSGDDLEIQAEAGSAEAGTYVATYVPKEPGAFRVYASATGPDGADLGIRESGWASQPAAEEFGRLRPNQDVLQNIAEQTGGEIVDAEELEEFVDSLSSRKAPITEPWIKPLWHTWWYFVIALVCLAAEWGLRRIRGLP